MTSSATALNTTDAYSYDEASRLESWTHTASGTTAVTTYAHDAAGNLTGVDAPGTADDATLTYGDANELETVTRAGVLTTYAHDDFGRRTGEETPQGDVTYTWNPLGQLTSVASADSTSTFTYGPSGMREAVSVASQEGTATTESVWAGGRLVAERDDDGTLYRYLYGPDSLPLELIVTSGSETHAYTYLCDRAGSVVALTDETGALVATYTYDPWGEVTSAVDVDHSGLSERNPLRYRGYYFDTATGLYYLPARYYDPGVARFLSMDPAPPSAGDPLSINRYAYCAGDPVNASDPTGAIMDSDGDGKVNSWDSAWNAAKNAKDWRYQAVYKNRAKRAYAAHREQERLKAARLISYAPPSSEEPADAAYEFGQVSDQKQAADTLFATVGDPTPMGVVYATLGFCITAGSVVAIVGGAVGAPFTGGASAAFVGVGAALLPLGVSLMGAGACMIDAGDKKADGLLVDLLNGK